MKVSLYFVFFLIFFFGGCKHPDENIAPQIIDPTFQKYVDMFKNEAKDRNIPIPKIDRTNITFGNLQLSKYGGLALDNNIIIDSIYWKEGNGSYREQAIFHELGHAVLDRTHDNSQLENGELTSIMANLQVDNPNIKGFPILRGVKRKYYIDELFKSTDTDPFWSKDSYLSNQYSKNTKQLIVKQDFITNVGLSNFLTNFDANGVKVSEGMLKLNTTNGYLVISAVSILQSMGYTVSQIKDITNSDFEIEWRYKLNQGAIQISNGNSSKDYFNLTQDNTNTPFYLVFVAEGFFELADSSHKCNLSVILDCLRKYFIWSFKSKGRFK